MGRTPQPYRVRSIVIRLADASAILATIVTLCVSPGCSDSLDRPIVFVLPDGYQGPFVMVLGTLGDEVIVTDESYEIHVPDTGIVWLAEVDFARFNTWHQCSFRTESGELVDTQQQYGTGGTNGEVYYMVRYVGTAEEAKQFFHGDGDACRTWLIEQGILE